MTHYQIPQYIANLQFDKAPVDKDWAGIINPLTIYDRIDNTKENYNYTQLSEYLEAISISGKQALGAALLEWVVNRLAKPYGEDIIYSYPVVIAAWAASIDPRYGGCHIPDLEYELINNLSERNTGENAFISSNWPAKGNLQNILYTTIAFVQYLEDSDEWLERLYYLGLYVMPNENKSAFIQWFTISLERLKKYTPACSSIGKYEDLFEEHWLESRGLTVPPQLFDPAFDYKPEQNTELINAFISKQDHENNNYLKSPEKLLELGFTTTPYTFSGLSIKKRIEINIEKLCSENEDLSSLKTVPSIIKAAKPELSPAFCKTESSTDEEYSVWDALEDKYVYDYDEILYLQYRKLFNLLNSIKGKASYGLALAATEWILATLKDTNSKQIEMLLEGMWSRMDMSYLQLNKIDITWEKSTNNYLICDAIQGILAYLDKGKSSALYLIILARDLQTDKSIFDAWIYNTIQRIQKDYPQDEKIEEDNKIGNNPLVSRSYFFSPNEVYKPEKVESDLKTFRSKLDPKTNPFLATPEDVYLMSYVRGILNDAPYEQKLESSKEVSAESICKLADRLSQVEYDELALKCLKLAEMKDPMSYLPFSHRGLYYLMKKEYHQAIGNFTIAIQLHEPTKDTDILSDLYYKLGACYSFLEEHKTAYKFFIQAIQLNPSIREAKKIRELAIEFSNKAYKAIQKNNHEKVIKHASRAIELDPKNSNAYLNRSIAYSNLGDEEKSLADREMSRKLDPKVLARICINESIELNEQGEHSKAIEKGFEALQHIQDNNKGELCEANQQIGYAYGQLESFNKALEFMSKAIELGTDDGLAFANRAYYLRKLGRFDEAIKDYDKAIKMLPRQHTVFIFDNRGKTYAALGQFEKALADWQIMYDFSKGMGELLCVVYGHLSCGDTDKAKKLLKKVMKKVDNLEDYDLLFCNFLQYALQMNMKDTLVQCERILEEGESVEDYPFNELVKTAIKNGHPQKDVLIDLAKKVSKVSSL